MDWARMPCACSMRSARRRSAVLKVAPAVRAARSSWADASTMPAS
ncbi:Uncharacterised protein [Bordetella pertussis]|nr:Uncharacterised protein [Bordetella pertussis]